MLILGIETSCDETGAAIVEDGTKIISNVVASSKELHQKTGGIIPEVAAREQVKCIISVIDEALKQRTSKELLSDIDALAVTIGPGLIGSLLVGVETAKTIAFITRKPIIPVNHIFAHIYANWLIKSKSGSGLKDAKGLTPCQPQFPAIALVVSGGHTELFLIKSHNQLKWLGGTRDDAAGETFDKTARLLGLGFPGGPAISAAAEKIQNLPPKTGSRCGGTKSKIQINLPRPMIDSDDLNFSFSGLKTAVMREVNKLKTIKQFNQLTIQQLAYEIQEAITDVLVYKTLKAAKQYDVKSILLGGGVAANQRLKEKFQFSILNSQFSISLHVPPPSLCTDNAAYVASHAFFSYKPIPWQNIQAQPDLEVEV